MGELYVDPKFDDYTNLLIEDGENLIQMGLIKVSKAQALVVVSLKYKKNHEFLKRRKEQAT